jgi:D-3-phosphoglycerate dehydrogenase / 2-oxoglutarate reductase
VRILVAESIAPEGVERLRARHEVDEAVGRSAADLATLLPQYDALVVRSQVKVDAPMIAAGNRLAVIGRAGVGVDNVDLDAATRAGIVVVNAPTGNTIAAAEHTLGLLYALARRIPAADASVRRGEWKRSAFTGVELRGRTLGIIGMGKIGQAIAARALAMEMHVLAADPYLSAEQAALHGTELVELGELLERADVVTVHVPLTRTTRGMIGAAELAGMKPGAFILNVARGGIVDEVAAADALRSGHLGGAAFDVYTTEPPADDSPLRDAPNTVLTPHLGASTEEAQVAVAEEVADQILDVLDGRSARYAVNAPLLSPETARALAPYVPLAELLGRFFAQFARGGTTTLTLEIAGELAAHDAAPLVAAALRGFLESTTTERVNLVNAAFVARSRGLKVVERRTPDAAPFAALLTLSGASNGRTTSDGRTTTIGGTIAHGGPRIVRLDDYWVDMAPADVMLITRHEDRPGTMGRIGLILGEADVNISAMHLARSGPRADALMILALDDDVPADVADAIRAHPAVLDVWPIRLGGER